MHYLDADENLIDLQASSEAIRRVSRILKQIYGWLFTTNINMNVLMTFSESASHTHSKNMHAMSVCGDLIFQRNHMAVNKILLLIEKLNSSVMCRHSTQKWMSGPFRLCRSTDEVVGPACVCGVMTQSCVEEVKPTVNCPGHDTAQGERESTNLQFIYLNTSTHTHTDRQSQALFSVLQ